MLQLFDDCLSYETTVAFYEAFLELYLFAGFPAAIAAMERLHQKLVEKQLSFVPWTEPYDVATFVHRGEQLCRQIYTSVYAKMRQRMQQLSPQLDEWMIIEGYGKVLSRPGLSVPERELVAVAILTVLDWAPQQYAHLRGALNVGVSVDQCAALLNRIASLAPEPAVRRAQEFLYNRRQQQ